eukprot:Gb_07107 [translate_table: standard]
MEILPVNDLDVALHEFVNKDDKMAFYSCVQHNLEETRNKLVQEAEALQIKEEDDLILKVGQCMQEREKERALHPKTGLSAASSSQPQQATKNKNPLHLGRQSAFSDEEDEVEKVANSKTINRGRGTKSSQASSRVTHEVTESSGKGTSSRGRGRGRGSRGLKQTTLDVTLASRHSERTASAAASAAVHSTIVEDDVDSPSSDEIGKEEMDEPVNGSEPDETPKSARGRKRPAPQGRGRGRAAGSTGKRGRKSGNAIVRKMFIDEDEDENDDDEPRILKNSTPQTEVGGPLRSKQILNTPDLQASCSCQTSRQAVNSNFVFVSWTLYAKSFLSKDTFAIKCLLVNCTGYPVYIGFCCKLKMPLISSSTQVYSFNNLHHAYLSLTWNTL